jgi:spermidine/putrescine transport system permease protein
MTGHKVALWVKAVAASVYLFLHGPLLVLVAFSFNDARFSTEWKGFTWRWYERLFQREDILVGLKHSLLIGGVSTAASTVLGTLFALGMARHRFRGKAALDSLIYLPVVTPEIVVGLSLLILFGLLGWGLGFASIILAHIAFNISFVTIVVRARLDGMDRSLEEAALILGADEWTTFWRVTVPQLWPGILSGALLAFTMSFDDYVITSMVSGPGNATLPVVVYTMVRKGVEPSVNAISTLILIATAALIASADWLSRRGQRANL